MSWENRKGVQVWVDETFPEPTDAELVPYKYVGVLVDDRQHPTCGRVTAGRKMHRYLDEPVCSLCNSAEAEYTRQRRQAREVARAEAARVRRELETPAGPSRWEERLRDVLKLAPDMVAQVTA